MPKIEQLSVDMLTPVRNNAVLRLPGRRFPGVLVQGDSLNTLVRDMRELCSRIDAIADVELRDEASAFRESLESLQHQYEAAMDAHGLDLPYPRGD